MIGQYGTNTLATKSHGRSITPETASAGFRHPGSPVARVQSLTVAPVITALILGASEPFSASAGSVRSTAFPPLGTIADRGDLLAAVKTRRDPISRVIPGESGNRTRPCTGAPRRPRPDQPAKPVGCQAAPSTRCELQWSTAPAAGRSWSRRRRRSVVLGRAWLGLKNTSCRGEVAGRVSGDVGIAVNVHGDAFAFCHVVAPAEIA